MVRSSGTAVRELPLFLVACETMSGEKRLPNYQVLLKCSNWCVELTATCHLLCEAHLFIAIITLFLDIFRVFFKQMIEICFKQYIYIHNVFPVSVDYI